MKLRRDEWEKNCPKIRTLPELRFLAVKRLQQIKHDDGGEVGRGTGRPQRVFVGEREGTHSLIYPPLPDCVHTRTNDTVVTYNMGGEYRMVYEALCKGPVEVQARICHNVLLVMQTSHMH